MEDKGKRQLLDELEVFRKRVTELERREILWEQTDDAFIEEKNKLQSLIDSLEYGVTIQDREYNIIFQNEYMRNIFGHMGEKCHRIYEFREEICEGCPAAMAFQDGLSHTTERSVLMPSGETITWENTATPLRDVGGNITGCIEIVRDITKRKREERALRESEEKYHSIFENSVEGIFQALTDGRLMSVNPAMADMLGYESPDEMMSTITNIGRQLYVDPLEYTRFEELIEKHGIVKGFKSQFYRKDGAVVWLLLNAQAIKDATGKILYYEAMVDDITLNIQTEKQLIESEERYRTATESSNDGVSIHRDGRYLYVNQKFLDIYGFDKPEEIVGKDLECTIHPDDREAVVERNWRREKGEYVPLRVEFKGIRKDGTPVYVEISAARITFREEPATLAYHRDITERKRAEEALHTAQLQLSEVMVLSKIVYWENDLKNDTYIFNDPFYALYGTSAEQEGGYRMAKEEYVKRFVHPDDRPRTSRAVGQNTARPGIESLADIEHRIIRRDGEVHHMVVRVKIVRDDSGRIIKRYGANQDITERKRLEEKLRAISITDDLTGLYNRRGFFFLSEQQLRMAKRTKKNALLFFMDLDKLKWINDTIGHHEGDLALFETARVLRDTFRESDIIGRMGGDEFAVLAIDTNDETENMLVSRLQAFFNTLNILETRKYELSLSIGVAHYDPENPVSLDMLISHADTLMYEEKKKKQLRTWGIPVTGIL